MIETLPINFHIHSIFSDGDQTPEMLATSLSSAGVQYAALTDHDTIEGLPRFQESLKKRGIGFLSGVELTTQFEGHEAHLLGYGFDPEHSELAATLLSLRQARGLEVHSIARSLRKAGSSRAAEAESPARVSAAPNGVLEIGEAIDLIHRAGGCAFWAHPLFFESDLELLEPMIETLKSRGLDGLEGFHPAFTLQQQESLRKLAEEHSLLVCGGTDFHSAGSPDNHPIALKMPRSDWTKFRQAFFSCAGFNMNGVNGTASIPQSANPPEYHATRTHHSRRRSYVLRIFLPTITAIFLFLAALWGILLPSVEQTLLERKREMIRELTNSALSILASYQRDEVNGLLNREQAQAMAIARIEALRYGSEGKDYFWIQDMQPRMIMHPYRSDLNGRELESFTDPRGVPIFVEFAALVKRSGEGYIDYVWQWKDDPQRLEPKESYIKGFEPWGWIIGTGIYIDDVKLEIARIEKSLINTSLAISGCIVILLLFVLQQSLRIEKERQEVLDDLKESTERYHSLVEATTEGALLVLDERCRYANPTFLNMLGYNPRQLEFLDLDDLLPHNQEMDTLWQQIQGGNGAQVNAGEAIEGCLRKEDGSLLECILTLNPIQVAGQQGFILLAKDITCQNLLSSEDGLSLSARNAPIGIFRARPARRAVFTEINPAGKALLPPATESSQPALADFFSDPDEFDHLMHTLNNGGAIRNHILHLETHEASARFVSLSASLERGEPDQPAFINGILEDVTTLHRRDAGREALIEKLQASLLFLHEPLSTLSGDMVTCPLDASIETLAQLMTSRRLTAALVSSGTADIIGIVTDHDLRARVLAENLPLSSPVHTIMSAPILKIPDTALMYEALMRMEEKGVHHLAVEDRSGRIINVIDSKSLMQFHRYAPLVLTREIGRARSVEETAQGCERTAPLAKTLLDSSARPRHVTDMLASICDAATERLVQLAVEELGEPPVPFAFLAMGSQGRREQTLLTDQDNGIIYAASEDTESTARYFLRLGEKVCEGLNRCGYTFCRGGVMASSPRWCRSLPDWIAGFNEWVQDAEPQEIIDLSIFFDFRTVVGDSSLTHELRHHIHQSLADEPGFFHLAARNALLFKPPFRLLGSIYLSGGDTEHAGEINLKDAMMPMVSFARLYALRHQVHQTHTLERIEALSELKVILPSSRDEIIAAYDFLMQIRLQNQLTGIQAGSGPSNVIRPSHLGHIQRELLKQAFTQIAAVQKKVSYDFLGGA